MTADKKISIAIPAFNEAERIKSPLTEALNYLDNQEFDYEIIVADDGSTDDTIEVVKSFGEKIKLIELGENIGKGAAVRAGMLAASGDIKIFSDADFSTPIYEIHKLINEIEKGADICIGSRALDRSMIKKHQPFYRELMGKIFNKFVQSLVFKGVKDTQCGFKAFTKEAADLVFSKAKIDGFSFDVELLFLARRENLTVKQVPVEWFNDQRSAVHPIKDSTKMFLDLLKIKKLHKK